MPPGARIPGPYGTNEFQLKLQLYDDTDCAVRRPGIIDAKPSLFGIPRLTLSELRLDLKHTCELKNHYALWETLENLPTVPPNLFAGKLPPLPGRKNPKTGIDISRFVFGPLPSDVAMAMLLEENLSALATELNKVLLLDQIRKEHVTLWMVYENDGDLPFNPGSGSDQGPTARLALYATFDHGHKGLSKLGVTVIDMRTPRGTLPEGSAFNSSAQYDTEAGPYSGIASVDFEVTVHKTGTLKINVLGSMGVDSSDWGKLIQDFIHKKISDSPVFPWPKDSTKPFGEFGVAILHSPNWILTQNNIAGISYQGKIEFDANAVVGTHRSEAAVGAKIVLRTATVQTPIGNLNAEYSPVGAFVRGFARYNDGRVAGKFGIEGGVNTSAMIKVGQLGLGIEGSIVSSTDPALQTGNPAGSAPLLNPASGKDSHGNSLGGPAGHHGTGQIILSWSF